MRRFSARENTTANFSTLFIVVYSTRLARVSSYLLNRRVPALVTTAITVALAAAVLRGAPASTIVRTLRITGTTEAVRSTTIVAPRLAGQGNTLVITKLSEAGRHVRAGDTLVEFDRQDQVRNAQDRRAEYQDLEQQIMKKRAEVSAARAADQTALAQAEHDVDRAKIEVSKNELLPKIEAEKNSLALEQASAKLDALRRTFVLKQRAADADVRILEIQRDRALQAMRHAERNAQLMAVAAPFDGLVVLKQTWRGGEMGDLQEGDDVRSGMPILDVVDPGRMQVRARVNQADIGLVAVGERARIRLDAYDDLVFDGRVEQVSPLAVASTLTPKVRAFVALISIAGTHPNLMPDLSAAVDLEIPSNGGAKR